MTVAGDSRRESPLTTARALMTINKVAAEGRTESLYSSGRKELIHHKRRGWPAQNLENVYQTWLIEILGMPGVCSVIFVSTIC